MFTCIKKRLKMNMQTGKGVRIYGPTGIGMQKYTGKTGHHTAGNGEKHGYFLGTVNGLVKECLAEGYIAEEENGKEKHLILLEKGKELLKPYKVDGALIIAAGFGSRFVPLTFETPKGLLEVLVSV